MRKKLVFKKKSLRLVAEHVPEFPKPGFRVHCTHSIQWRTEWCWTRIFFIFWQIFAIVFQSGARWWLILGFRLPVPSLVETGLIWWICPEGNFPNFLIWPFVLASWDFPQTSVFYEISTTIYHSIENYSFYHHTQ